MAIFGKPGASYLRPGRLDVFVRSREATLVHLWLADGVPGALDLGGRVDQFAEPVAVHREPQGLDVFAVGGLKLLHWRWDAARGRMIGPEELPGYIATKPVPVAEGDWLYVFAADVGDRLRYWSRSPGGLWSHDKLTDVGAAGLVAVHRQPGIIDTYSASNGIVHQVFGGIWQAPVLLPHSDTLEPGIAAVEAIAWTDDHGAVRQDVYGLLGDGTLRHWGYGYFAGPDPTRWWGPDPVRPERLPFGVAVAARGPDIVFRDEDGRLHHWIWQHGERRWDDFSPLTTGWQADPVIVERMGGSPGMDVVAQVKADTVRVASWDTQIWSPRTLGLPSSRDASGAVLPEPAQDALAGATDDVPPAFLLTRPADHVVLGVHAVGYRMTTDPVPRLVAEAADAHLVVTFPPQHIAEEVSAPGASALLGDVWQAQLSGSSRIAITAAPTFELTAAGVLAALHDAPIDPDEQRTAVELPWGLIVAPQAHPGAVVTRHPNEPVDLDGTTGLWRTRFGTDAGDGGVAVAALRAGRPDPFPMALTKANRVNIAGQSPPARADRLELSSLGGTLIAAGSWRTLEWEQRTVGGRDQRVRTATKGVLYPFGHRAVFVETTERSADEPVAVLRKTRVLYVTEPTVDGLRSRAFPFDQVECTRLEYGGLADADWQTVPRPTREIAELQNREQEAAVEADRIFEDLYGSDAMLAGMPQVEELAAGWTDDADELLDPDDPEGFTRAGAARTWLAWYVARRDAWRAIQLLQRENLGAEPVETFFLPTTGNGEPIRFPMRCRQPGRQVGFELPLVFVADLELGDEVRATFRSLDNLEVTEQVHRFYTQPGHGIVDLPGAKINMVLDAARTAPGDVQEVHRLNIAGSPSPSGAFVPSLGRAGEVGSWAAEVALPALRTLLDRDPRVRTVFDQAYLSAASDDIPLRILDDLGVDFTTKADRSGGLAAPKYVADGVSRIQGLVNVAGSQSLDPADLFTEGATLLGFDLRELVRDIPAPPEMVTLDTTPPEVRLSWADIPLGEAPGGDFLPLSTETSTLTLTNTSSAERNETTCVITDFKLVLPRSEPMIEISFGQVGFRQVTGEAPQLTIDGLSASFVGKLRLLDVLQEKVGLGRLGPQIVPTSKDITARYAVPLPDVAALSFVLSNLNFSAALRVPFDGAPVSLSLGFASRARPFTLTVLMFGGGGYVDLELDRSGLRRLEVSLQFGAALAINLGIATAEVHAFGGIRYELVSDTPRLAGFLHIGGSVELLGLVSVAVELHVELAYQFDTNALVGRAKIVVEIDVTLFSESVELDSGEWVIAGGAPREPSGPPPPRPVDFAAPPPGPDPALLQAWRDYRGAFE